MVIVKEGTLQAHVNGKEIVVGSGGVLFFASMQPHAVRNIGDTPATYYVINWGTGESTKKIPSTPSGAVGAVVSLLTALLAGAAAFEHALPLSGLAFCQRSRSRRRCSGVSFFRRCRLSRTRACCSGDRLLKR
jgi:hypothetical protein